MIYLYHWDNSFDLKKEVSAWKEKFVSKFGDFNLVHIKEVLEHDNNFLHENLLATSFLWEKKLIIIDDVPSTSERKDLSEKETFLLSLIDDIPEENIVLFNSLNPDKRGKLFKELKKKATVKEFAVKKWYDLKNELVSKFGSKIEERALDELIRLKSENYNKIAMEIEKLNISIPVVSVSDVKENVMPELEEGVFEIANDILDRNKAWALKKLDLVLNQTNIYSAYNAILSSLRTTYYIYFMKSLRMPANEITERLGLGKRWFLVNKNYRITPKELKELYFALVEIDSLMKSGKLLDSDDKALRFEVERIILTK